MHRAYLPKALALTTLAAGLAFAGAQQTTTTPDGTMAQGPAPMHRHHAPDPQHQAMHLARKLNLSAEQQARLEPILADRDQKMQALHANTQLSPDDRHQQTHAIMQGTEQQMAGVLTPDQLAQLKAMHHHGHHGMHGQDEQPTQSPS